MVGSIDKNDFVVVTHINLNKQPLANSDLALYISYLSKGFHLDGNDVIRGMDAYKTEFRYELSKEAVSEDEDEDWTPGDRHNNIFTRRDRSMSSTPSMASGSSRSSSITSNNSANSVGSNSPIGRFAPATIKQMNQAFQLNLREFLKNPGTAPTHKGILRAINPSTNQRDGSLPAKNQVFTTTN